VGEKKGPENSFKETLVKNRVFESQKLTSKSWPQAERSWNQNFLKIKQKRNSF